MFACLSSLLIYSYTFTVAAYAPVALSLSLLSEVLRPSRDSAALLTVSQDVRYFLFRRLD